MIGSIVPGPAAIRHPRPAPRQIRTVIRVAAVLVALFGAGCIPSDYGGAPFACAQSPACPEGYYCGADHVCHRGPRPADLGPAEPWPWDTPHPDTHIPSARDARPELSADAAAVVLFQDDFTTGGNFANDGLGNWSVANGVMTQKKCDTDANAIVASKSWTNVMVTVKLRGQTVCPPPAPDNYSYAGLLIRAGSIGTECKNRRYYMCAADFANSPDRQLAIVKIDGDAGCLDKGVTTQPVGPVQINSWYTMSFSAVANVLTCTISGAGLASTTVTFTDTGSPLAAGSAGVFTFAATVSFDDFVVVPQ